MSFLKKTDIIGGTYSLEAGMKIIDISMAIDENTPVYKNKDEKRPEITVSCDFSTGSIYESGISMNLHTGTHIDMPLHMIPGGATSDRLDISKFIAPCIVLDFTDVSDKISDVQLQEKKIPPDTFVLLKTKNSYTDCFDPEFIYLDASGADYLKGLRATGVGIDALGIERSQPGHETHKILFRYGIPIIEGLRLAEAAEGAYDMIALPLRISNVEALPARVVLIGKGRLT
jgi:arylformamidase